MNKPQDLEQTFRLVALMSSLKLHFIFLGRKLFENNCWIGSYRVKEIFFQIRFLIMKFLLAQG